MVDLLAKQSVSYLQANQVLYSGLCVNPSNAHGCPFPKALQLVTINDVMVFMLLSYE
jgi:hypothetical protein